MDEKLVSKPAAGMEVPESAIYFVYMVMFIDVIAACISTPVMPYYAQSFGVPTSWIGYLYAAWSVSATLFAPALSSFSDKWGRKYVLVLCLVGAGVANLIQGLALYFGRFGFWVFLFGRAFSGCWASVGATCNVYITDVVTNESLRGKYLGQLSMVPLVAIMVGPGLGGGLAAAYGNNFPVMIDGFITLFSAGVVYFNLSETPAFLRAQEKKKTDLEKGVDTEKDKSNVTVPFGMYVVGLANFIGSAASQSNLSMYALFYQSVYDFTSLYVGFLFMGSAVVMLLTNMLIVPQLKKRTTPRQMFFLGGTTSGICNVLLGFSDLFGQLYATLGLQYFGSIGSGISSSQSAVIVSTFTTVDNRGKIFGLNQTFQNFGKIIGPIMGTNLAVKGLPGVEAFMGLPFLISGSLTVLAATGILGSSKFPAPEAPKEKVKPNKRVSAYGQDWEDEDGTSEDVLALGKYVSELLKSRHYKWISRRAEIEMLLDDLLPELQTEDRDMYNESLSTLKSQAACVANVD